MSSTATFLGIDLGTSSVKAALLDLSGAQLAEAGAPCAVERGPAGEAESPPSGWWRAVTTAVRALPAEGRAAVRGIGLSGQMHGVVLADGAGAPVRPAILWLDTRGATCLHRYPLGSAAVTGNAPSAGMAGPTLLWLAEHEPEVLARARWALQPKDWVRLVLTGEVATDPSDASGTLLAGADGLWDDALVGALGLPSSLLPPVLPSDAEAGRLRQGAAEELGLPAGVAVATGAGDSLAAALGSGLLDANSAQLAIGTSAQVLVPSATWPGASPGLNVFRSASPEGWPRWCLLAAMLNGGAALEWARAALGLGWEQAFALAFPAEEPESGALFLPYLAGERTPWMDPVVRGAWVGLSAADGPGTLMRAAFEGVALALRAGLDALRAHGAHPARLRLAGGGTVHPRFRQLLADVLQVPLDAVSCPNAAARGAALLGALAAGALHADDLMQLAPRAVPAAEPRQPEDAARLERFQDLYHRLAGWSLGEVSRGSGEPQGRTPEPT